MKFQNKSIFDYFSKENTFQTSSTGPESDYDINCNPSILREVRLKIKDTNHKYQKHLRKQKTISFNPIFTTNPNLSQLIQLNQVLNRKTHRSVSSHNIFFITKVNKHHSVSNKMIHNLQPNHTDKPICKNNIYLHVPQLTHGINKKD